jgi:ribulose-5-phosphate 4-epimerase/fuculose-1-phosphate aldolase
VFGGIRNRQFDAHSFYHGLQTDFQRRLARFHWLPWAGMAILAAVWGAKTWNYVAECATRVQSGTART